MSAPCPKCGHNPAALVTARWTFTVEREIESLNAHRVNAGSKWAQARYRKLRDEWVMWMTANRVNLRIPVAAAKRRVTITRVYSGRQREFDRSNLVGGCKPIWDSMVRAGMLVDDKPAFLEDSYLQRKGERPCTEFVVEELV